MAEIKKVHSVKYNFIMNFILTSSQFLFPLITFPYVSRILLAEGNGRVAFASSVANYFLMVASLGIPTYGIRACSQVRDDKEKLSKTVHELFIINVVMTSLVLVVYLIMILSVPRFMKDRTLFYINGINMLLNCAGMNWLFQALEKYDYITVRSIVFKIISILLMFMFVHGTDDVAIYAAITVFSSAGSNVLNFVRVHKFIQIKKCENYEFKKHLMPIFILFSQTLVASIYTNLDTVMLGFMKTSKVVGLYNAAVKIKGMLVSLVTSLGSVLLPRMSYYLKNGKADRFEELTQKAINFTLFISIPISCYFVVFSKESLIFLSGNSYIAATPAMQFVTFAVIAIGMTGILGIQVLTSTGREKYVLYSVAFGACVDLLLNFLLIPTWGASGAAFATMIAEYCVLLVQINYTKDILSKLRNDLRIHKYIIGVGISCLIGLGIKRLHIESAFLLLVISAICFFGTYAVIELLLKEPFAKEIINTGLSIIRRKKKRDEV